MSAHGASALDLRPAVRALQAAVQANLAVGLMLHRGDLERARQENRRADETGQRALRLLRSVLPEETQASSSVPDAADSGVSDLAELAALDTQEAHMLLTMLERALVLAERVDAQRGRSVGPDVPLLPGESRGTDLAEAISELCLRLRTEIHGPNSGRE